MALYVEMSEMFENIFIYYASVDALIEPIENSLT